jgi:hypothetical protein
MYLNTFFCVQVLSRHSENRWGSGSGTLWICIYIYIYIYIYHISIDTHTHTHTHRYISWIMSLSRWSIISSRFFSPDDHRSNRYFLQHRLSVSVLRCFLANDAHLCYQCSFSLGLQLVWVCTSPCFYCLKVLLIPGFLRCRKKFKCIRKTASFTYCFLKLQNKSASVSIMK